MFEIFWGSGGGAPGKIFVNLRSIFPGASWEKMFLVSPGFDRPGFRSTRVLIDPGLTHQKINPGIIAVPCSRKLHYWSIGNNFRIMIGTDWILWQEISRLIVFYRLKHETHVEYSTFLGLWGHFRYQKKFLRHFFKNPLPQFCRAWSGEQIKYPQHGIISWIEN